MRSGTMSIFILAACIAVVALSAALAGYSFGASTTASTPLVAAAAFQIEVTTEQPQTATQTLQPVQIIEPPPDNSISVPGFERLIVQGKTLHAADITNPTRNTCYFVVSIILADGTVVYRSGVLARGQVVGTVELIQSLSQGRYEGTIARYSCYAIENMQPLNGADILSHWRYCHEKKSVFANTCHHYFFCLACGINRGQSDRNEYGHHLHDRSITNLNTRADPYARADSHTRTGITACYIIRYL